MLFSVVIVGFLVATLASVWVMFQKAGEAGWKSLIPIYNVVVLLRIVGRPWWWLLLMCIPLVNLIPAWLVSLDTARSYGKGMGFAVGVALLTPVFYMMLAFGDATYVGPGGAAPQGPQRMARAA